MINYPDGTEACIGDVVSLAHGTVVGVVREVIDSSKQADAWGLEPDDLGLMVESKQFGLSFYPALFFNEGEIRFVSRAEN